MGTFECAAASPRRGATSFAAAEGATGCSIRSVVLFTATRLQRFEHEDGLQMLIEKRGGVSTLSCPRSLSCTILNLNTATLLTLLVAASLCQTYCKDCHDTQSHTSQAIPAYQHRVTTSYVIRSKGSADQQARHSSFGADTAVHRRVSTT